MSPRTKEQCEEIREKRIEQILEAAEQVFLEKGSGFDIRDVAKKAGLGYGTVYHYYKNKSMLLHDLIEKGFLLAEEQVSAVLSGNKSPVKELEHYCNSLLDQWLEQPSPFIVYKLASENFSGIEDQERRLYKKRFLDSLYKPVESCLQLVLGGSTTAQPLRSEQAANTIIGTLIGSYGIYVYHNRSGFDTGLVTRMVLKGIQEG